MKYKRIIFLLAFILATLLVQLNAQTYRNVITRVYPVSNSTVVEIDNKYGKVHVNTWDRDSVKFEIELRIQASNNDKLNKLKSSIDFDFTKTTYYVTARTLFQNRTKTILGDIIDIAESMVNTDNQITINYMVYLPSYASLKIENKFGDVYIDDYNGNITLNLGYGDLKANNLNGNSELNLNSSDAIINKITKGKVSVAYSDVRLNKAVDLEMETRSSNVFITDAQLLLINSSRDKYELNKVAEIKGESYFTMFNIDNLITGINLNTKYGKTYIDGIHKNFSDINITSTYTDVNLLFDQGTSFKVELFHHGDVIFNYPKSNISLQEELINKEENEYMLHGIIGNKAQARSKIKLTATKKCQIDILIK